SAETLAATQAGPEPFGLGTPVGALIDELGRRGVTVRILDAGPDSEGAVTQLIADPAARDMARWAAWRRLTPAALYGISLGLGLGAAIWFAELDARAKLLAIPALAGSFLFARTGSLLAATSREGRISPLVGWLGIACGLLTEPALYAALAVSSRLGAAGGLGGAVGGGLRAPFATTLGGAGGAGGVAAGHRRPAPAGRAQAGRARLRAHGRGAGGPVCPVRAAHPGAGAHLPGRRAVRGDRADLGLLRAAADLLDPARLGRAGGGI